MIRPGWRLAGLLGLPVVACAACGTEEGWGERARSALVGGPLFVGRRLSG